MSEGWVYILLNEAMPDFIKIGLTRQNDVSVRLKQLDNTSTPLPFECYFAARVPDCERLERTLHFVFGEKRARISREFFRCDKDLVKAIIELVAIQEEEPTDQEQAITPAQRSEIEATKRARQDRTLQSLGIMPGETLTFAKDPDVTCVVAGPRTVVFQDEEMSLSKAALKAVRDMGYSWGAVSGFEYWLCGGKKLSQIDTTVLAVHLAG
jgi:hypothetical protein